MIVITTIRERKKANLILLDHALLLLLLLTFLNLFSFVLVCAKSRDKYVNTLF